MSGAAGSVVFPSPLRGGVRGGGRCLGHDWRDKPRPPPRRATRVDPPHKGEGKDGARGVFDRLPPGHATPIRLISHSNSTPLFSRTRRRTSSPKFSISAALALPRLIKKLQCSSDTCASPTTRPRQPAASIRAQAF